MERTFVRSLSALTAVAAIGLTVAPASAHSPTRVADTTVQITCQATAGGTEVTVEVARSDIAGTASRAEVTVEDDTFSGDGTSDWAGTSFRSTIPVTTHDGEPAGQVSFSGSYQSASEPVTNESKFKVGNVHVVERHSETSLGLNGLTLVYNGQEFQPDRCDGSLTEGYLSYTNPNINITRFSRLPYECTSTNGIGWPYIDSPVSGVDELYVDVLLAEEPVISARGIVAAGSGSWTGSLLRSEDGDDDAGVVDATATLVKHRQTQAKDGEGTHFKVTPYDFTLQLAGGAAWEPTTVQCTLYQTAITLHTPNPEA